jgi:hypothetical protein
MTTKTGDRYTSSRRDLVHGSLTFHVEVTGVLPNGTVLATQYAIEYPNGSTRPSKPVRLEISRADFRHYKGSAS